MPTTRENIAAKAYCLEDQLVGEHFEVYGLVGVGELVRCVGCPLAIRIEEKGEGFENGN